MTFTIEQLEALKEGTTPGPWEFVECSENQYGDLEESRLVTSDGEDIAYDVDDSFGKLIAASPALLDQLIATEKENWELRNKIISLEVQAATAEHDRKLAWQEMRESRVEAGSLIAENDRIRKAIEKHIADLKAPLCHHYPEGAEMDIYLQQWSFQTDEVEVLTQILEGNG